MRDPSGVYCRAGRSYDSAQLIGQKLDRVKAFRSANAAAARYDDISSFEVDCFADFLYNVDQLCADLFRSYMEIFLSYLSVPPS